MRLGTVNFILVMKQLSSCGNTSAIGTKKTGGYLKVVFLPSNKDKAVNISPLLYVIKDGIRYR